MQATTEQPKSATLQELCYKQLLQDPAARTKLYALSVDQLVELNSRLLKERADLQQQVDLHREEDRFRYLVDPPYVTERVQDEDAYGKRKSIVDKWRYWRHVFSPTLSKHVCYSPSDKYVQAYVNSAYCGFR